MVAVVVGVVVVVELVEVAFVSALESVKYINLCEDRCSARENEHI